MTRAAAREARQRALARFRLGTRLAREDLNVLAQRLEDCPPWLDGEASGEWKRAATAHGAARAALQDASSLRDVIAVHLTLREAWFRLACADALAFDEPPPTSSEPCFFNPQHGPAAGEVAWAPPGREPAPVQVCRADATRIEAGIAPMFRRSLVAAVQQASLPRADLVALNSGVGWTGGMFQPTHSRR